MSDGEQERLHALVQETESRFREVEEENWRLRKDLERKEGQQSAFTSNNRAFTEKLDLLNKEVRDKDELIRKLRFDAQTQNDEGLRLREEINLYKGRCANLQRDVAMTSNAMSKFSSEHGGFEEQLALQKNRVTELEEELARTREERTDQTYEIRRLTNDKEKLEEKVKEVQVESVKNQGSSQTSSATITRLQSQL